MSEGWEECPLLGPGWKRRSAVRKSGASCGHSDTYYQSPTGERFRSKIEMGKFLGESVDLSMFDFKNGVIIPPEKRRKRRQSLPPGSVGECQPKKPRLSEPTQLEPEQNGTIEETLVVRCQSCKVWFAGVNFGRSKQSIWYCADCRASRRAFNKAQRFYKTVGCGVCAGCKVSDNCGYCTVCLLRSHNPEFGSSWKCVRRRCLQVLHKGRGCGTCQACSTTEDCQTCSICIKRQQDPDQEIKGKCVKRRCLRKGKNVPESESKTFGTKKLTIKWKPFSERDSSSLNSKYKKKQSFVHKTKQKLPPSQHFSGRRKNRKCGACEACLQKVDCGECDFCQDKPKFGGRNLKRQKCRWRQCLRFAMEKNIPAFHKSSKHPMLLERIKREAAGEPDADSEDMEAQQQDPNTEPLSPLRVPVIKLERMEQRNGHYLSADELHHSHVRDIMAASRAIKQEMGEASSTCEESEPLNLHRSVKTEEFIIESDDIAEADESTPVIMEIFSLGSYQATSSLDSLLQEFMSELNEIPLPAHWEVQAHRGPNLQLVQRSRLSTMADTVIHIQPGLHFHVVVRGQLVPSFHELYTNHPSRLTTVDDVVELICDLEAYQLCDGHPQNALRSPECRVLVYEERCAQCCTIPWPSGSDL